MLSLRKPSTESIRLFLAEQSAHAFTYPAVGATATTPPAGYAVDRARIKLGAGESIFESAKDALRRWEQFRLGWVEAWSPATPIKTGEVVAVLASCVGLWWLNAARIISVVDESGPICKFGFAYGTLPGHVETGEERFLVEWHREDDSVWYDILAFSKPNHILAKVGYPIVRLTQKRFREDSTAAMMRAVASRSETTIQEISPPLGAE